MNFIYNMLITPDDFKTNLYGLLTNQGAHISIVGWGLYLLVYALLSLIPSRIALNRSKCAFFISAGLYLIWEAIQLFFYGGTLADGLLDMLFVSLGLLGAKSAWDGNKKLLTFYIIMNIIGFYYLIWSF